MQLQGFSNSFSENQTQENIDKCQLLISHIYKYVYIIS